MEPTTHVISSVTLRRLLISGVLTTLVVLNTLGFGLLAVYKFSTNDTSPAGYKLVSQYYMFTDDDPHYKSSYCAGNMSLKCPRGGLILSRPRRDEINDTEGPGTDRNANITTEASGSGADEGGGGTGEKGGTPSKDVGENGQHAEKEEKGIHWNFNYPHLPNLDPNTIEHTTKISTTFTNTADDLSDATDISINDTSNWYDLDTVPLETTHSSALDLYHILFPQFPLKGRKFLSN